MANRDVWNYYMQNPGSVQNPLNTNLVPSSPPYDNLNVIDAPVTVSLQPTQRSENQTPVVPGPAQLIQRGLFRKRAHDAKVLRGESSQSRTTQDFIREAINEPAEGDQDFSSPRWTSTIDYIIREGSYNNRTTPFWTQIVEIQSPRSQFVKVKKIVAMLASLTPNGLGDLLVTLKDPSGKIEGTMHHNIFNNDEYRLSTAVGAVVILQNVTVCRFNTNAKYLNITDRNIVKIIGANSMLAEYETPEVSTINEEDERTTGYEYESVPDSDDEDERTTESSMIMNPLSSNNRKRKRV